MTIGVGLSLGTAAEMASRRDVVEVKAYPEDAFHGCLGSVVLMRSQAFCAM
jgi:hypothetical protein